MKGFWQGIMARWMKVVAGCFLLMAVLLLAGIGALEPSFSGASTAGDGTQVKSSRGLPLGPEDLSESRSSTELAPGVTYTHIARGKESSEDFYTVDAALTTTEAGAREVMGRLSADGYEPRLQRISERPPDTTIEGPFAYLVRVGEFASEEGAAKLQKRLEDAGYGGEKQQSDVDAYQTPTVVYTGSFSEQTTGPWLINVLEIDPDEFSGNIAPALATEVVPGKEKLTSIASRTGVLAAVNGGYFVVEPEDGTPGDLAGISVIDERLVSEAVNGRTSLLLPSGSGEEASVATLSSEQSVTTSDGALRVIDGLNRKPGLIRSCGGVGGDEPTQLPKHDVTCTDGSELVLFTPSFGKNTEPGEGVEVVLDSSGQVTEFRERRGGEIPPGGTVLAGTGDAAEWLRLYYRPGDRLSVSTDVYADGEPLSLDKTFGVVNGGPRLLRGGELDITADAEGFNWPEDPGFYYGFGVQRHPRTLAGIKPDGTLLFVAIDGGKPGYSLGASFEDSARVMQTLGATEAVNLDGGGSTTMTLGEELVNRPSDDTGERPISDAILILEGSGLPNTGGELPDTGGELPYSSFAPFG